jgi:hypothetical protein
MMRKLKMKKSEVVSALSEGVVDITFTKVSGQARVMKSTLASDNISYSNVSESVRTQKPLDGVQAVWDVESMGWRSFRWSSVTQVGDVATPNGVDIKS